MMQFFINFCKLIESLMMQINKAKIYTFFVMCLV